MTRIHHDEPVRLIQGRLMIDPARTPEFGWIRVEDGRIAEMGEGDPPRDLGLPDVGGRECVISPGFIDAHFHVPQIDSVGCDGMELLSWLNEVVFPAEAWWGKGGAIPAARTAARRLLEQGTFGVAAYLTSHAAASREAFDWLATRTRLRFIAGRVAMDREAPEELTREDRERAKLRPPVSVALPMEMDDARRRVSVNPRFAISCSDELLAEVGWFVKERSHPPAAAPWVQTHLSETLAECTRVAELFRHLGDRTYTAVYDQFGLLTARTLLAHGVHLSASEWELIAERRSILVHCPGANLFLRSGFFDLEAANDHGVRVALGSDVAGGPDVAMPRVARAMIETAKIREMHGAKVRIPTPAEAWRLITRGNADLLEWPETGRLERGAAADVLLLRVPETWHDRHLVGRLIYNWSAGLIEARILDGRLIDPARI